jgi:hypothetical protein
MYCYQASSVLSRDLFWFLGNEMGSSVTAAHLQDHEQRKAIASVRGLDSGVIDWLLIIAVCTGL